MSNAIDIYWSGYSDDDKYDWNILYEQPESLFKDLSKDMIKENVNVSYFRCPGFKQLSTSTFVVKNPLSSSYSFKGNDVFFHKNGIFAEVIRPPAIENNLMFRYSLPYVFFSEESIEITFTAPYFHKSDHLKYGAVVPGRYNISSWIRPIQFEINLWDGQDQFHIDENEALAYFSFVTNKKINLKQFKITNGVKKVIETCSKGGDWEPNVSIFKRYSRFNKSKMRDYILGEIKNNLL